MRAKILPCRLLFPALFIVVLWGMCASSALAATESNEEYYFKAIVETRLEERLYRSLSEITGTEELVIIVNAEVETDPKQAKKQTKIQNLDRKKGLVLPGVPIKREIGRDNSPLPDISDLPPSVIKKLNVIVLVDESVDDSLVDVMRDVTINAVGFDPDRGDLIDIRQIRFTSKEFPWVTLFHPPNLFLLLAIIFGSILAVSASLFLINPFKHVSAALRGVNWAGLGGGGAQGESGSAKDRGPIGAAEIAKAERGEGDPALPFSFVQDKNLPELLYILGKAPLLDTAIVINYLPAETALKILENFPTEKQAEIAFMLRGGTEIEPEKVKELEETLRDRLDFVLGGDTKLASILNLAPDEVRDSVLETIESRDEEAAERLRKKVKSFEEIMRGLSPQGIQILYRQIDPTDFAIALKSSPTDIQKKVMDALSEGAAERMQEEIQLGQTLSEKRLKKEKNNIISIVTRLSSAGLIEEIEE